MKEWLRVTVKSPSDERAGLLAEGLLACGGGAIEERDGALVTYIAGDVAEADVRATLRSLLGGDAPELEVERVPEQDWLALWRAGLEPRRVGERIVVSPTWSAVDDADGDIVIRVDPQMAFGTGEHASTRGVLTLMQRVVCAGDRLLDVGSGSAILAIAGVLLGATSALAVESDPDAQENAAENVARNGVESAVTLVCDVVDERWLRTRGDGAFDGILANVLSGVLIPLLPAFHQALVPDGWAILSGILGEEAAAVSGAARDAGFRIEAEHLEENWWSVLLRRA